MSDFTLVRECLCCGATPEPYLDLGKQPLANNYHKGEGGGARYPLEVAVCPSCWHSQLTGSVNPKAMFDHYVYVSGTSNSLRKYFIEFKDTLMNQWNSWRKNQRPRVLEIASNDGTLLDMFQKDGCDCLGIDPAKNLLPLAHAKGVKALNDYWNMRTAARLNLQFDIVLAVNVLPHVPNPLEFLTACRTVMEPNHGRVYIQTSQCDMFTNGEFDAVYHEHMSYFTAHSFAKLATAAGLRIVGAKKAAIHSSSFVWELAHGMTSSGTYVGHTSHGLDTMLADEKAKGLTTTKFYEGFAERAKTKAASIRSTLANQYGRKVIGYGASAKANTLLNFINFSLSYIVDDNPMKWGTLTPGTDIPIVPPKLLTSEREPLTIMATAWNFLPEIKEKVDRMMHGARHPHKFFSYFPINLLEGSKW